MGERTGVCLGYEEIGVATDLNTAGGQGLSNLPVDGLGNRVPAKAIIQCCLTADAGKGAVACRWKGNGDTPTATDGMQLAAGAVIEIDSGLANLKFIGVAANAKIVVSYFAPNCQTRYAPTGSGGSGGGGGSAPVAGTGISVSGSTVSIDTSVTVDKTTAQTLTNKTLTSPAINTPTITGSGGAITLPAGPDTLVGRATTDTLTNKTLTNAVVGTQSALDSSTKAASTAYVDSAVAALAAQAPNKAACKYATAAALAANIYSNGSSGVGATLTGVSLGAVSFDGSTPSIGDSVLVKNEVAAANNGIYTVTTVGSAGVAYVLTRRSDFNQTSEIQTSDVVFVSNGATLGSTTWQMTTAGTITVGTTAIAWSQIAGPGTYLAGNGLTLTGSTFAIDTTITVDKTTAQSLTNKTFDGTSVGATQSSGDSSTKLATTAFVQNSIKYLMARASL